MRWSLLLTAASVASASILPRAALAPNLPASAFPKFTPISEEDAKAGKDLLGTSSAKAAPEVMGLAKVAAAAVPATAASCAANPQIRYEWDDYPTADRNNWINAIKCLINKPASGNFPPAANRFEDFARLHQKWMPNLHGNANFLIWHRYFLWTFEQTLRRECGFTSPMPWWDEAKHAGKFSGSDIFSAAYFGVLQGNADGSPICVTTGAFAGLTCHIGPGSGNQNHCLSRSLTGTNTAQVTQSFVDTCNSRDNYNDMAVCSERGPHAYGHNGIGGVMADVSASPSDPMFWMHHSFVDHSYRIWQNLGGGTGSSRTTTINGVDVNGNPLSLDYEISVGALGPNVRLRDIIDTLGGVVINGVPFCYKYNH